MEKWTYMMTSAGAGAGGGVPNPMGDAARRAIEDWTARLNELGQDGWELVSEHRDVSTAGVLYTGTLKRRAT